MRIDIIRNIVDDLIYDLNCRSGLGNEWDQIDDDIRLEIKERWVEIIPNHIKVEEREISWKKLHG